MNEPLRPSNLGEILDRTVQFYRARFLVFFGVAAVPTAVVLVFASGVFLLLAWSGSSGNSSNHAAIHTMIAISILVVFFLTMLLIFLAVTALASAAMNHAAACAYLGDKTTIREAYRAAWRLGWRYLRLYILEALVIWVAPAAVCVGILIGSAGAVVLAQRVWMGALGGTLLGVAGFLVFAALVGYVLWMLLELSLAFPACVVEQIRPWAAIKRSSSLSKGTRGRIFLLYMLGAALTYLLSITITVPLSILMALLPGANSPQHAQSGAMVLLFVVYGAVFAVQALTRPVYGIALMLFYYDQRIRLEGFDIEWMMQQAGLVVPVSHTPRAAPWLAGMPPQTTVGPEAETPAVRADVDFMPAAESAPEAGSAKPAPPQA
jgi:hypothetical protein